MNKIVIITGANSGLGKQLKNQYENQKDIVINISLNAENDNKLNYQCDVSNYENLKKVFDKIVTQFKKIDVLINCAGYGLSSLTELVPIEDARKIFDVNFWGCFYCIKLALPYMEKGAKIVNISSACAIFPLPYRTLYCTSKAALLMLSQSWELEIRHLGIHMTAICPGDIKTNFTKNRQKIWVTNEKYGDRLEKATKKIDSKNDKRMDEVVAGKKIFKICQKNKYKPYYIVSKKFNILKFITRFFPKSAENTAIYKLFS